MTDSNLTALNLPTAAQRLAALRDIKARIDRGEIKKDSESNSVNNHIHTIYSFSPYSPSAAMYMAWKNGLCTAGIMDHDSIAGAREFLEAGKILGIAATIGMECRVNMEDTRLCGKRINNPDQKSIAYVAMHGVSHEHIEALNDWFAPYREARNRRNRKMCENITQLIAPSGVTLDFDKDVLPLSCFAEGGSVTERHLLFALALKLCALRPQRSDLCDFLSDTLGMPIADSLRDKLLSAPEYIYPYDILGILKSHLVEKFYIPATDECPSVREWSKKAAEVGAIAAYAYLGDVGNSVTGDKKTQAFEDSYLPLLFEELPVLGFNAVTYMPTRNTREQLALVMNYCRRYNLFQISGEDINSPRQSFICAALDDPAYFHLRTATYALIGHENAVSRSLDEGMFSKKTMEKFPKIDERVAHFTNL